MMFDLSSSLPQGKYIDEVAIIFRKDEIWRKKWSLLKKASRPRLDIETNRFSSLKY